MALVTVVLLYGCTSLPSIERGVCGNGLLEPGEDCDSSDASCIACQVTCTVAGDCPTTAYGCGVDHLCHAPSGRLATPNTPQPFPIDDLAVTDIDKDGIGDVLGVSQTSIEVHYGDTAGGLATVDRILTPIQGGVAAIADTDGDGALDVAFGTTDGVVVYSSPFGKLTPLAGRSPIDVPMVDVQTLFTIDPNFFGILVSHQGPVASEHKFELVIGSVLTRGGALGSTGGPVKFCGGNLTAENFSPDRVDVYVAYDALVVVDALLVITGQGPGGPRTCATSMRLNVFDATPVRFYDVTPPTASPTAKAVFARTDSDANNNCPALVIGTLGAASPHVNVFAGAMTGANETLHCGIAASSTQLTFLVSTDLPSTPASDAAPVGHAPFAPVPFDPFLPLTTWSRDGIVLSDGVYGVMTGSNQLARLYTTARPASHVASGDFNGDGKTDLVMTTDGQDDLDILYRQSYSFAPFRVDTATRPILSITGDFDGNGDTDVAYVEPVEGHERMLIAYGTPDRVLGPVEVESFKSVVALGTIGLPTSLDQTDSIDDIVVVDQPGTGTFLTLLRASAQRTMLSYFDPRQSTVMVGGTTQAVQTFSTLDGVVVGRFSTAEPAAFVFGHATGVSVDSVVTAEDAVVGWPMQITPDGLVALTDARGTQVAQLQACNSATPPTTNVCIPAARYVVWPIAGDRDVIVAVDRQRKPSAAVLAAGVTMPAPLITAQVPVGAVVRSLHVVDLDGDGTHELLASFGPGGEQLANSAGLVELCPMDAAGHSSGPCEDLGKKLGDGLTCVDATPGHLVAGDPSQQAAADTGIAVLCYAGTTAELFHLTRDGGGDHVALVSANLGAMRAIALADVTGDGVDDLIGLQGGPGAESLVIYAQCTSTQTGCGQ